MKKSLILIILIISICQARAQSLFYRSSEIADATIQCSLADGEGLLLGGGLGDLPSKNYDPFIARIYPNGEVVEYKFEVANSTSSWVMTIEKLQSGNFFISGFVGDHYGNEDTWIAELNPKMQVIWSNRFGNALGIEFPWAMIRDSSGTHSGAGYYFTTTGDLNAYVFRVASNGDSLIERRFWHPGIQQVLDFDAVPNSSNYIMTTNRFPDSSDGNANDEFVWLDQDLNIIKVDTSTTPFDAWASLAFINDSIFIFSGNTRDSFYVWNDEATALGFEIVNINTNHRIKKSFGARHVVDYPAINSLAVTESNAFWVTGTKDYHYYCYSSQNVICDKPSFITTFKFDFQGDSLTHVEYGGDANYSVLTTCPGLDGSFWIAGAMYDPAIDSTQECDYFVMHLDSLGRVMLPDTVTPPSPPIASGISIYPNPFSNRLLIHNGDHDLLDVQLYDAQGRLVLRGQVGRGDSELDGSTLADGFYVYRMSAEAAHHVKSGRLVKR